MRDYLCYKQSLVEVYRSIDLFYSLSNTVITIGIFDGVHYGHRKIIKILNKRAKESKNMSVLISFDPHPIDVFQPKINLKYLTILEERILLLNNTGLQNLIFHPFNKNFSNIEFKVFVENYLLNKLKMKHLIVGYDNCIGKNKMGCYKELKKISNKYKFEIEKFSVLKYKSTIISSTYIRQALLLGNLFWANKALGYPYIISGKVIRGDKLGSELGFPTANILVSKKKLIPKSGVYAVKVKINLKIYIGMLNIGVRPTFGGKDLRIEVHILDFYEEIYNKEIYLFLIKYIRNEKKFDTISKLKHQLQIDEKTIRYIFF